MDHEELLETRINGNHSVFNLEVKMMSRQRLVKFIAWLYAWIKDSQMSRHEHEALMKIFDLIGGKNE